jgi:hypothetical protein
VGSRQRLERTRFRGRSIQTINRQQLETGSWDGQTFQWLQRDNGTRHELNVDTALGAAQAFQRLLRETQVIAAMSEHG